MKRIKINDLSIKDIFQNIDAQFINEKLLNRILDQIVKVKFDSIEIFSSSSFEKILENDNLLKTPFEIAEKINVKIPNIPLQITIGAKNLVGTEIYSNSIIKNFIKSCINSGINIFRVYDALNDFENFKFTVSTIIESGAKCQGTIIYDDLQQVGFYAEASQKLYDIGCESICIKDAESTLVPYKTQQLFKELIKNEKIQFHLSAYNLRGLQVSNYYTACMEGCSGVDLSFIPSSYNDLNPTIFSFILSFKDTDKIISLDYLKIVELFEWFKKNLYPLIKNDIFYSKFIYSNKNQNLLPKWLISSINNQLLEIGEQNKIDIVLEEIFNIKNEIGNPSLATPIGQIIGSQAILNTIISDYRWEITNDEIKKLVNGYYGKLPRKIDENVKNKIIENIPGDIMTEDEYKDKHSGIISSTNFVENQELEQFRKEIMNYSSKEQDILSYIFFPEKTLSLIEKRKYPLKEIQNNKITPVSNNELKYLDISKTKASSKLQDIDLNKLREITNLVETSNIDEIKLEIDGVKISINKKAQEALQKESYPKKDEIAITTGDVIFEDFKTLKNQVEKEKKLIEIKSPIVGIFYRSPSPGAPPFVNVGDKVKKGDTLCIIEAMKLMNKINSEYDGEIVEICVNNEDAVEYDQTIMVLKA